MGKTKRKFNSKARQVVDDSDVRKADNAADVPVEFAEETPTCSFELDSNYLVLPSKRQKVSNKNKSIEQNIPRKLSKKQRKNLQRVLDQKEKKARRAQLFASLAEHQASSEELSMLSSASHLGQKQTKKQVHEKQGLGKINSLSGSNKRRNDLSDDEHVDDGCKSSSSSSGEEDEDEAMPETGEKPSAKAEPQKSTGPNLPGKESKELNKTDVEIQGEEWKGSKKDEGGDNSSAAHGVRGGIKPVVFVNVERLPEIQESRLALPILAEEQEIMELINEHPVVIICGETGSGKTTQVPQFLYEAGYTSKGMIGVTEPRRVAAVAVSKRVAKEMSLSSKIVSYQIRFEGNVSKETKVKFMTDGVLLKEIQKDFLLTNYSVIIIDEAHERSVYTDILIGLLSRIVPLRHKKNNPLKLIIMSATLCVEDFTQNERLFKEPPPVKKVESRQFPVTVHFNKRTELIDYVEEAYKKIMKIHRTLPPGGILVFVTGQNEVSVLCRRLKAQFRGGRSVKKKIVKAKEKAENKTEDGKEESSDDNDDDDEEEADSKEKRKEIEADERKTADFKKTKLPKLSLDSYSVQPFEEAEVEEDVHERLEGIPSEYGLSVAPEEDSDDEQQTHPDLRPSTEDEVPLYVLPMYSLLQPHKQALVFKPSPEGTRLCVVATNVAETSLTIPGIKYVVDTGRVKKRYYDKITGVSSFKITWTSKASANQRAGRAGRTEPGHCYRLYSSAVFSDEFETFDAPEITRRPVDDLVLQMKDMGIEKVVNFPFPSPPDLDALKAAERLLIALGALEQPITGMRFSDIKKEIFSNKITPLGKAMACFPVSPCYAKMIALGQQQECLPYVIALVSALTVREIFDEGVTHGNSDAERETHRKTQNRIAQNRQIWAGQGTSRMFGDLMVLLGAVGATEFAGCTPAFCASHGLRYKALAETRKLRRLLTNAVNSVDPDCCVFVDPQMKPPTDLQIKMLRQIVLVGLAHHVARRMTDTQEGFTRGAYQSVGIEGAVFIHPSSVLVKDEPEFVVYQEIIETTKPYMKGVMAIEDEWLPHLLPQMCTFSKPLEQPPPCYDEKSGTVQCHMTSSFGRNAWQIPAQQLEYPSSTENFKLFAMFFLEGKVIKKLKKFSSCLLSSPSTMTKTWSKLLPRTQSLLNALNREGVDCRDKLMEVWKKDEKYLLAEYCEWLPPEKHSEIMLKWPPIMIETG